MRKIQVYIKGQRLELFNDEKITINSSIQNVYDIAKVFTDYSQGFTVPASPHNNAIFQHFYQSDVDADLLEFDYRVRQEAKIEIESIPFKIGKIQLEKANLKNGQVESYTCTFYGDIVTLKDTFGELKLIDLDYSTIETVYNGDYVKDLILDATDTSDIYYPLISSDKAWTYDDNTSTDIKNKLYIKWNELFPAVRVKAIFDIIQAKFGITFNSIFLDDERFTKAFLLYKNRDTYIKETNKKTFTVDYSSTVLDYNIFQNLSNWSLTFNELRVYNYNNYSKPAKHLIQAFIVSNEANETTTVITYKNNIEVSRKEVTGSGNPVLYEYPDSGYNLDIYTFEVFRSTVNSLSSIDIVYNYYYPTGVGYTSVLSLSASSTTLTTQPFVFSANLKTLAPDMKIADFFTGILKEFNLVCYGISSGVYQVEPLDSWYQKGALIDITKHVEVTDIEVSRVPIYKRIALKYQESKSFLNQQFKKLFNRNYGDALNEFPYDGGEYLIQVPFENLLFSKFTGTNLQVGYTLEEYPDYKPYTPKPILLYKYGIQTANFLFETESTPYLLGGYNCFGQDLNFNGQNYTLNFNAEISTITNVVEQNTLLQVYYFGYLTNLFNPKNRITNVKTLLPISILTGLRLNDRVIIRDKRFIINNMKSDLTTGEVDFELINDFRPTLSDGSSVNAGALANCMVLPVLLGNTYTGATLSTSTVGVTITPSSITEDTNVQICIPDKTDKQEIRETEDLDIRITEDGDIRVTEDGYPQLIAIEIVYTGSGGALTTELTIIQI